MEQLIPKITPMMLRDLPDQTSDTLNRLVDKVNTMQNQITELNNNIVSINHKMDLLYEWVDDIDYRVKVLEHMPYPGSDYAQVLLFNAANMGTRPGWCLANVDAGFGISGGVYDSAREDWESQQQNGTLHPGTPPINLQVPVYIDTGTVNGHVVVWDRGTVWSDGHIIPEGLSYYSNVIGWGEYCDGSMVVRRVVVS